MSSDMIKNGDVTALSSAYAYDEDGNVTKKAVTYNGGTADFVNAYDKEGRITTASAFGKNVNYTYDENDQLVSADGDNYNASYSYDARGNITSKLVNGETTSFTYANTGWKDQLVSVNGTELTYDANGNVLTYGDKEYLWNTGRHLASITDGDNEYTYTYDENGIRTSKTVNDITTYYNTKDGVILSQTDGTNTMYFQYDNSGIPLGFVYNETQYFYVTNQMGDVIGITEANGNLLAQYAYDDWGKLLAIDTADAEGSTAYREIAEANPLRYRGYYFDSETGYYYLQSRYYAPEICRFINADVMIDTQSTLGINLFSYCENNPIMYFDPDGYGKIYVIYYNNPGSGFKDQAMNSPYYNKKSKNVYFISVISNKNFINAWNSMSGTIDYVYLYIHGGTGVLYFKGETLGFKGKQSFKSLKTKKVNRGVYLFSCYGGAGKEGNNVAWMFAKLTSSKVYACTGSVSYSKVFGKYYARKAKDWGIIKTFFYQKRYVFWGSLVARSAAGQW